MKPAVFEYVAPTDIDDAVRVLAEVDIESKVIAGGQSLVPSLNMRLAQPERLVDISRISDLDRIDRTDDGQLVIGAAATQSAVAESSIVHAGWPIIAEAIGWIGHPQIRNRGTVCGNLAHHDPASELPAVAVALEAVLIARGSDGERHINADAFFVSTFETALDHTELLVEVRFPPIGSGVGCGIEEVARRRGDFAIVGAVVLLQPRASNEVAASTVVLFGVGSRPFRSRAAEAILANASLTDETLEAAAEAAAMEISPSSDIHATADDRRTLARVAVLRSLRSARERMT